MKEPDYFDELKGTIVEVATKFLEDGSYFLYKGILAKKGRDFIYLRNGEIFRVKEEKSKIGEFDRFALNKSIVSWVNFG